jgi:hypothetical protein
MKKSKIRVNRRDFLTRSLEYGTFIGLGCSGLFTFISDAYCQENLQDKHKFQIATNFTYEKLFDFAFRNWFISYMKLLQNEIGAEKFLNLLAKAGNNHYHNRVKTNFEKIKDKSVQSLIENFWEPVQRSKFGNTTITIEISEKKQHEGVVKMTECLFAKTFRENDADDIGYAAICNADFAVAEEFNSNIKLTRNKCLMNGDECCFFQYHLPITKS